MKPRRLKVAAIVAAALVAVTTIVLATFATMSHLSERRQEMARLRLVLDAEANQLAEGLALPIWNIDRAQIDKVVDGVGSVPHVHAVAVEAAGQTHARIRDRRWRFGPWNGRSPPAELLVEERPIRFSGEAIGTLRIFATRRFIDEGLRMSLWSMIVTIVLVDLLLSLSVYAILWPSVLRPLGRIEQYAHAVSATGAASVDMPLDTGAAEELNSLRSSIQSMVHALREALDFTDTAINAMTGLFFVMDRNGKVIRRNDTMDRLTDSHHRMTQPPLSLVHPDDKPRAVRTVAEVFERGVAEVELRVKVEGTFRDFLINARRMDVHGESFVVGSGIDVTERRQAEAEQLRLRNELVLSAMEWRQTFDTVMTPILIIDRNGSIRRFNRAALELAGLSEFELLGTRVEAASGEPWSTAAQLVASIAPHDALATAETRDGQGRTWDIAITHFATPGNGDSRFILVFWEITGIVELQESLRRSETLSAMGTLVAGVAHEVRNPLFGMSATLDAYQEELSRPGYELFHSTLRREVRRLTNLMQELLEYGKPSVLSLERESVPDVIDEAIESRSAAAHAAGVEVENLVEKNGVTLLIDRSRLQQVFGILIDNAVQHSPAGGHVRIRSRPVEQAGRRWIELLVEDEGRGFRSQDLDRVFDPFFTSREGGTGLGLSIVQRIVEEHSGKVGAGNRSEGGAVVTILLPVADAKGVAKAVAR